MSYLDDIYATYRKNLEASGSYIKPSPTPAPAPNQTPTVQQNHDNWVNFGGAPTPSSGGVSFTPAAGSSGGSSTVVSATVSAEEQRRKVVAGLTLSPAPSVAAIQKQAQNEYIKTGVWSQALTDAADAERKRLNASYPGGERGSTDSQYLLPGAGGSSPLFDGLGGLFTGVGNAAGQATAPGNNGTFMLLGIGAALFLLLGRRR